MVIYTVAVKVLLSKPNTDLILPFFRASIQDIYMDIAEVRNTGSDRAYAVEQCNCPRGYRGLSCEVCMHLMGNI